MGGSISSHFVHFTEIDENKLSHNFVPQTDGRKPIDVIISRTNYIITASFDI